MAAAGPAGAQGRSTIEAEAEGNASSKGQGSQRRQCSKHAELGIMYACVLDASSDMSLLWLLLLQVLQR